MWHLRWLQPATPPGPARFKDPDLCETLLSSGPKPKPMMWDFWYRLFVLYLQTTATSSYVEIRLNNKINSDSDGLDLDTDWEFLYETVFKLHKKFQYKFC